MFPHGQHIQGPSLPPCLEGRTDYSGGAHRVLHNDLVLTPQQKNDSCQMKVKMIRFFKFILKDLSTVVS